MVARRTSPSLLLLASVGIGLAALFVASQPAQAQAVVSGGNLNMGIQAAGQLTVDGGPLSSNCHSTKTSMVFTISGDEAMDCDFEGEGWGLTYDGGPVGFAYRSDTSLRPAGTGAISPCTVILPLPVGSFASTASTAVSTVQVGDVETVQTYEPFPGVPDVYQDHIQLTNTNATLTHDNVLYRRVMSWGSAGTFPGGFRDDANWYNINTMPNPPGFPGSPVPTAVVRTGVVSASTCPNPLATYTPVGGGTGPPTGTAITHSAWGDNAMVWDFNFGSLAPLETRTFTLYYGAAEDLATARADIDLIDAEIYNIAEADTSNTGSLVAFFMAFGGLTGPPPPPQPPVAGFSFDAVDDCLDSTTHFWSTSTDADSAIASFVWDFGDTTTGTGPMVDHQYAVEDDYWVTLTVTDTTGLVDTYGQLVHAYGDSDCPPELGPTYDKTVWAGKTVKECFTFSDVDPTSFTWEIDPMPPGASFDPVTKCLTWLTTEDQAGIYYFTVTLHEGPYSSIGSFVVYVLSPPPQPDHPDADLDSIEDIADNCPSTANRDQADLDRDGIGDACQDGFGTDVDCAIACLHRPTAGHSDLDLDGIEDAADNCPSMPNRDQRDTDGDGQGDLCDVDVDGDGIAQAGPAGTFLDNCPLLPNTGQSDGDGNGVGDACQGAVYSAEACAAIGCITDRHDAPETAVPPPVLAATVLMVAAGLAGGLLLAFLVLRRRRNA